MATNQNAHVNTFTGGMNTDTGYDMIKNDQYVMSINNRVTTTKYTTSVDDSYSNQKKGLLAPVCVEGLTYTLTAASTDAIQSYNYIDQDHIYKILTSGETSIILYKNYDGETPILNVGKLTKTESAKHVTIKILFCIKLSEDLKNISAVLNEEQADVIKLYIATGSTQLLQVNVADEDYILQLQNGVMQDDGTIKIESLLIETDDITSNLYFPHDKLIIDDQIYGQLKTSQIQYTYRFYKKHGVCSKLAPLTNKIQVINPNKTQETGCAEDTTTAIGFRVKIDSDIIKGASRIFDRIQIYRISYVKINTNAEVKLLFDGKFDESFSYDDIKQEGIQELTMEEFSDISGLSLQPKVIAQNQKYLFCGDVTDTTIINFKEFGNITEDDVKKWYRTYRLGADGSINGTYVANKTQETLYQYIQSSASGIEDPYNYMSDYDKVSWVDSTEELQSERYNLNRCLGGVGRYINWEFVFSPIPSCNVSDDLYTDVDISSVTPHSSMHFVHNKWSSDSSVRQQENNGLYFNYATDKYLSDKKINKRLSSIAGGYSDNIISSTVRSLRRGEIYRYGIVFYNKNGNRTNVFWIQDIRTPGVYDTFVHIYKDNEIFGEATGLIAQMNGSNVVYSLAVGIKFNVTIPDELKSAGIIGYEIVRCEKNITNTKNLYQIVLSRPVQKTLPSGELSPFYPTGFITTQPCRIVPGNSGTYTSSFEMGPGSSTDSISENLYWKVTPTRTNRYAYPTYPNKQLFQCFCPEYYIYNKDVLNNLAANQITLVPQCYINPCDYTADTTQKLNNLIYKDSTTGHKTLSEVCAWAGGDGYNYTTIDKRCFYLGKEIKTRTGTVIPLTKNVIDLYTRDSKHVYVLDYKLGMDVTGVYDSQNATWSDGFSNLTKNATIVTDAVNKYETFVTNASTYTYLNWVCSNKYRYPAGASVDAAKPSGGWSDDTWHTVGEYNSYMDLIGYDNSLPHFFSRGPIGPAGPCFIATVNMPVTEDTDSILNRYNVYGKIENGKVSEYYYSLFGTFLCNAQHTPVQFSGITEAERQYDTYYGFGNYVYITDYDNPTSNLVFDGDVYPDAQEIYTLFKAYDFNDTSAYLQSTQILYYIPMESTVNWRFDYGMNYKNTGNNNLQLEAGEITGVSAQDRILRQYNSIYSDNNTSNNIYNTTSTEDSINTYHQRLFYSELKTPGESIDNWQIFKSTNCIDCNSEYGPVTDLYTFKDTLYVWQNKAFSKLSVNERSLVKDENSNIIQLGQGDVLQRVDYISTNYGMRQYDMCKTNAENVLYWFDYYNKCIVVLSENSAIDYTNAKNVKSIMENYTDKILPRIVYDQKHREVLFGDIVSPINENKNTVLVFNTDLHVATGLYYTDLSGVLQYDKSCVSISSSIGDSGIIKSYTNESGDGIVQNPTYIQFVVNTDASTTKVFDNQQIVTGKRTSFADSSVSNSYFMKKTMDIDTDICEINNVDDLNTTDREGNIKYALPRYNAEDGYGYRIRGKYMLESILDNDPNKESTISHIITKYRTSYN